MLVQKRNLIIKIMSNLKKKIRPCKREDIIKNLSFTIAKDASLNISKLKKLKKVWKKNFQ